MQNSTVEFLVEGLGKFEAKKRLDHIDEIKRDFLIEEYLGGPENRVKYAGTQVKLEKELGIPDDFYSLDIVERKRIVGDLFCSPDVNTRRRALAWTTVLRNMNDIYFIAELDIALTSVPAGVAIRSLDEDNLAKLWEAYTKAVEPFRPKAHLAKPNPKVIPDVKPEGVSEGGIAGLSEDSASGGDAEGSIQEKIQPTGDGPEV